MGSESDIDKCVKLITYGKVPTHSMAHGTSHNFASPSCAACILNVSKLSIIQYRALRADIDLSKALNVWGGCFLPPNFIEHGTHDKGNPSCKLCVLNIDNFVTKAWRDDNVTNPLFFKLDQGDFFMDWESSGSYL